MNRALRRKFNRYAANNGIPKAINKFLVGEEKQNALQAMEAMKKRLISSIPQSQAMPASQDESSGHAV